MHLFCYGTLQFDEVMRRVSGRSFQGVPVLLDHYACYTVHGEVFPGIVHRHNAQTPGLLYSGLTDDALRRLDAFESDCYAREHVTIRDDNGRTVQAWAYVVRPDAHSRLSDLPWEREQFERLHLGNFLRRIAAGGAWWERR